MDPQMLDTAHGQIHVLTCGPSDGEARRSYTATCRKPMPFWGSPNFQTVDKELEVHQLVTNLRQSSLCSRGHQCPVMSMYFQLECIFGEYRQVVLMLHGCPSDAWTWKCLARWIGLPNTTLITRGMVPSFNPWANMNGAESSKEWHIRYSSCIDHIFNRIGICIFIIHSSIFNINQPTSSGKEAVNRKKKQVAFSTIALQQISCNRSGPSHSSRFQWSSKLCWMLEGMACSYKIRKFGKFHVSQSKTSCLWWFLLTLPDFIIFVPSLRYEAIDMPGFGNSPGTRLGSRSELNNVKGGPLDIACAVLDALGATWGSDTWHENMSTVWQIWL